MVPEIVAATDGTVTRWLVDAGGLTQYVLVFALAAFPWVEILVVVPVAVGIGLNPLLVGVVAFAGNLGSVFVLLAFSRRVARWRAKRGSESDDEASASRRARWMRSLWDRYGLPGVALASPVLTGVHLAAMFALAARSRPRDVGLWMTISIAAWTVVLVVGSVFGVSLLGLE
ncbi:MAG: small multi-drug export protein [Halorubrum sp.]